MSLYDGSVWQLVGGENPLYAEFLDTNGRLGWRLTDKYGYGVLLELEAMRRFFLLLSVALGHEDTQALAGYNEA